MVEVVIPTKNDYLELEKILGVLKFFSRISRIVIVDNASSPQISSLIQNICSQNNCHYVYCATPGKGNALQKGIQETEGDVLFLDADIENLSLEMVFSFLEKSSFDLVKATFKRKNGQSNSAFILDAFQKQFPQLSLSRPTSGLYFVKRTVLQNLQIPPSWSADLSILLQAYQQGFSITEIDLGIIEDKPRSFASLLESKKCLEEEFHMEVLKHGKCI